jgi:hypothetical protein
VASGSTTVLGTAVAGGEVAWSGDGRAFSIIGEGAHGAAAYVGILGVSDSLRDVAAGSYAEVDWRPGPAAAIATVGDGTGVTTTSIVDASADAVTATIASQVLEPGCADGTWSPDGTMFLERCGDVARVYRTAEPGWSFPGVLAPIYPDVLSPPFWTSPSTIVVTTATGMDLERLGEPVTETALTQVATDGSFIAPIAQPTPLPGVALVQRPTTLDTSLVKLDGSGRLPFGPSDETTVLGWLPG